MKLLLVCFITSFLSVFILQSPVFATNNFPKSKASDSTEVKSIIPSTLTTCADLKEEITKIALKHDIASLISDRISLILQDDSNHLKGNKETFNLFYFLHFQSHCLLKGQVSSTDLLRGNFNDFETLVDGIQGFLAVQKSLTLQFAKFLLLNGHRLSDILSLKLQWNLAPDSNTRFQKYEKALVTPGIQSMFEHCKKKLEWDSPDWKLNIQKGYQSPINQFIEFVLSSNNIKSAISLSTPPYYGGHHLNIPDITVNLISINSEERPPPWNRVYHLCDEFGFTPKMPGKAKFEGELEFRGIKKLYEPIFSNTLVPRRFAREFEESLYKTHFLPSPRALRIILALSAQESTIQWNPKLNKEKKQLLRARFHRILSKLKNSLPGSVSTIILAKEHKVKLEERINELNKITDPSNDKIREYDFYLWSRETNLFIHELVVEYKRALEVGQWFVDLGSFLNQLEKEPQTFGLWQINVNHLVEKVKTFHQLRRIFPEIYKQTTNGYIIDRDLLIKALSGRKDSPLSRRKTLELIILTHLKPRYRNHHQGDKMDLVYFVAENMAGEMSTYRASIQHELNLNLRAHLVTDGDLSYYLPHSTSIDWSKKSNTMKKLEAFVAKHHYYFRSPVNPKKLIKELCEADSWLELKDLELYQKIIRSDKPVRRFPQIESKLYHQTPLQYSKTVLKKSRLF